jgi:hypothetical protein
MNDEHDPVGRGDPSQVLDALRGVLMAHMNKGLPHYQVQSAVYIGQRSGRLMSDDDVIHGHDAIGGLRLTMQSGHEYDLTLTLAETGGGSDDETATRS